MLYLYSGHFVPPPLVLIKEGSCLHPLFRLDINFFLENLFIAFLYKAFLMFKQKIRSKFQKGHFVSPPVLIKVANTLC